MYRNSGCYLVCIRVTFTNSNQVLYKNVEVFQYIFLVLKYNLVKIDSKYCTRIHNYSKLVDD